MPAHAFYYLIFARFFKGFFDGSSDEVLRSKFNFVDLAGNLAPVHK